jgi:hypothetical protein
MRERYHNIPTSARYGGLLFIICTALYLYCFYKNIVEPCYMDSSVASFCDDDGEG